MAVYRRGTPPSSPPLKGGAQTSIKPFTESQRSTSACVPCFDSKSRIAGQGNRGTCRLRSDQICRLRLQVFSHANCTDRSEARKPPGWFSSQSTLAAAGGVLAGRGDITLTILAAGGAIGVFLLVKPTLALWFVILGGLVLTGLTQLYLPQFQFVRWVFALLAWASAPSPSCGLWSRRRELETRSCRPSGGGCWRSPASQQCQAR